MSSVTAHEPAAHPRRLRGFVRDTPSGLLMIAQLVGLLVFPFVDSPTRSGGAEAVGHAVVGLIGVVVLVLAVRAVRATPALTWVAWLLGVPVVVLTVVEAFAVDSGVIIATCSGLTALFYLYTAYALIRYMFSDSQVTADELWATGATFTVIAWGFTYLFVCLQVLVPGSFSSDGLDRSWLELLFMSVANLTGCGLSDIVPVLPNARSFVAIEQITGMLYVALVVSRLVGLAIRRARR